MSYKLHTMAVVDERIAGNARFSLIWLRKTTINHKTQSICSHRRLTPERVDRNMAVDDFGNFRIEPKLLQDKFTSFAIVGESVICALLLFFKLFKWREVALEGGHFIFVVQWRKRATPKVPHIIQGRRKFVFPLGRFWGSIAIICIADNALNSLQKRFAAHFLSANIYLGKCAVGIHWNSRMIEQAVVFYEEETAALIEAFEMLLQTLRMVE